MTKLNDLTANDIKYSKDKDAYKTELSNFLERINSNNGQNASETIKSIEAEYKKVTGEANEN